MGSKSRSKGVRGEHGATYLLRRIGFPDARRTAQHRGNHNAGDVECPDTLPNVVIEVKNRDDCKPGSKLLDDACEQAQRDADGKKAWCVLHKPWRGAWMLTFAAVSPGLIVTVTGEARIREALWALNDRTGHLGAG